MIKTITDKLFEQNIELTESGFRADIMISNIEAYAYINRQSIILFDYKTRNCKPFNYNQQFNGLLEYKSIPFGDNQLFEKINKNDLAKIERYLEEVNKQFHCKKTYREKNFFFSILFSYSTENGEEGCCIDFIPLLYNRKLELCYTLCKLEAAAHAGKPILRKHHAAKNKTEEYLSTSKRFIESSKVNLSTIECQILRLSGEGEKEHEIANRINTSLTNVKRYKSQIFEKMQVKSISEAIFIAYKRGQL